MGDLSAAEITALSVATVAVITALSTKGVTALIQFLTYLEERKARNIDLECDEEDSKDLRYVLRWQAKKISTQEKEIRDLQHEAAVCLQDRTRLQMRIEALEQKLDGLIGDSSGA